MLSIMGKELADLEILKCKKMNVVSVSSPGAVKGVLTYMHDKITCLTYKQTLNRSMEFDRVRICPSMSHA